MVSNRFIGCNIFFRFVKVKQNSCYKNYTYTRVIPIENLKYIDYDYNTNKTTFYFKNCKLETIPEKKEYDVLKSIETQINNGYNFIDIKDE